MGYKMHALYIANAINSYLIEGEVMVDTIDYKWKLMRTLTKMQAVNLDELLFVEDVDIRDIIEVILNVICSLNKLVE